MPLRVTRCSSATVLQPSYCEIFGLHHRAPLAQSASKGPISFKAFHQHHASGLIEVAKLGLGLHSAVEGPIFLGCIHGYSCSPFSHRLDGRCRSAE